MKLGVVLNKYPVLSETFIQTFLSHFEQDEVVLFAYVQKGLKIPKSWKVYPYLNKIQWNRYFFIQIVTFLKIIYYFKRFRLLKKKGVKTKQLLAEANIWTQNRLDFLHFPFGNTAFKGEHYSELLDAKMTLSFRGSDVNVYPYYHGVSYSELWYKVYKIQCNSQELYEKLRNEHQLPENLPTELIYPALRSDYFDLKIDTNKYLSIKKEKLITIGRLHWVKNYELTFQALQILKNQGFLFEYTIIGNGTELEKLKFLANFYQISELVEFKGGLKSQQIIQNLHQSTLYVQTSYAEGFSNSCLEAQALGLMCVVTPVSGMSACIENHQTGIIINENKPELLAHAIQEIHSWSADKRIIQSKYVQQRVNQHFTLENQKKQWQIFFKV